MPLNHTFENVAQVAFGRVQKDFAVSMNVLKKYFNVRPNTKANQTMDFLGKIDAEAIALAGLSDSPGSDEKKVYKLKGGDPDFTSGNTNTVDHRYRRNRATPNPVQLGWRRRSSDGVGRVLNVSVPRADAQVTGHNHDFLVNKYTERLNEWFQTETLSMFKELLTAPVIENPRIAGFGAEAGRGKEVTLPDRYRNCLLGKANASNTRVSCPLEVSRFFYLTADLQNSTFGSETESSINRNTGSEEALKGKCTIFTTNTVYAMWKDINQDKIGNRDYMGSSIILGKGKIHEFQNYQFLTVPDEIFGSETLRRDFTWNGATRNGDITIDSSGKVSQTIGSNNKRAGNTAGELIANHLTFTGSKHIASSLSLLGTADQSLATNSGGFNTATANTDVTASSYIDANGMYRAIVFDPKGFQFLSPTNMNVRLKSTDDFTQSYEKFLYKEYHLEGIRIWDPLVRELYFTPRDLDSMTAVAVA